jgi:3-dehydroquinate synthase
MDSIQQQLQVTFRYPVHFTTGLFAASNPLLRDVVTQDADRTPADVVAVVDRGVVETHPALISDIQAYVQHHHDVLRLAGPILVVPGGEAVKNDTRHVDDILRAIQAAGLCRHSYVFVIGGGAVLDVVGYAAATAHRGVRLVRIPTTVLA